MGRETLLARLRIWLWLLTHTTALELWVRNDVAGHSPGCRMLPTEHGDHGPWVVACDCYASTWHRWGRRR